MASILKEWYYALEDKYYDFMDSLEDKLHVYEWFVNPIEDRGVPSFPVFVLIVLALIAGVAFLVSSFLTPSQTVMQLTVVSSVGLSPVPNATVSVQFGSQVLSNQTDENGNVSFTVPANSVVSVSVSARGFNPVSEEISTSSQSITIPNAITLSFASIPQQEFLFTVVDGNGNPLQGASVTVSSLSGGGSLNRLTDSSGHAVFNVTPNSILTYSVSLAGYQSAYGSVQSGNLNQTVSLTSSNSVDQLQGGSKPSTGLVLVSVNDSSGNPVYGTVNLYDAVSNKLLKSDTENGSFSFNATVGESVYVTFSGDGFLSQTSSPQTVSTGQTFFSLTVLQAVPSTSENVSVSVVDGNGNSLSGVYVQLFQGNSVLESGYTDSSGSVVFTISKTVSFNSLYLTAFLSGYLPVQVASVSLSNNIVLNQLLVGGYGSVEVNVVDAGGNPVVNGNVNVYTASGLNLGFYPVFQTDANGNVNITGLPVNVSLIIKASFNSAFGSSDSFVLTGGEVANVNIQLSRPLASVVVNTVDMVSKQVLPGVSVLVSTVQGLSVANCTTNSKGACVLNSVWGDGTQLVFTASLNGYASYTSAPVSYTPLSSNIENINMVSNAFNNQTLIIFNGVTSLDGKPVTSLSQGGFFVFHFTASFVNSSQEESLMFRVGDQSTVDNESAYITGFSYSPAIEQPVVIESASYNPSGDCSQDILNTPASDEGKWVEVKYSGLSGAAELNVIVFVKPNTAGQSVNFYYRASSVVNGFYSRDPFDSTLNYSQRVQGLDSCYANAHVLTYNIIQGNNYCNSAGTACVELTFNNQSSPFTGLLNEPFTVNYKVENFGPVDAQSVYVLVKSLGKNIIFKSYAGDGSASVSNSFSSTVLLGVSSSNYSGSFTAVGVTPVSSSQVYFEFGDERGAILSTKGFVSISGVDGLNVQVSSTNFTVGKKQTLTVLVTSVSNNQPVTDATVSLNEVQGSVFNGNPPSPIVGDDGPGSGEDGKYVFNNIVTLGPGVFQVQASQPNFQPGSVDLNSIQTSFFAISPSDYLPLTCNSTSMQVTNTLDIPVSLTISAPCVNITGFNVPQEPNGDYFISNIQPGKTVYLGVQPLSASSCIMTFTSSDPRSGYNYFNQLQVQNNCNTFGQVNYSGAAGVIQIQNGGFKPSYLEIYATLAQQYAAQQMNYYYQYGQLNGITGFPPNPVYGPQYPVLYGTSPIGLQPPYNQNLLTPNSPFNYQYYAQTGVNPYSNPLFSVSFNANSQLAQLPKAIAWINQDPVAYNLTCADHFNGQTSFANQLIQPGGVFVYNFSAYGLFDCHLNNGGVGQVQIDSVCQGMSAKWFTNIWERCMAREFINNAGWFGSVTGESPITKKISASIGNQFTLTVSGLDLTKNSDSQSTCRQASMGGIACVVKVSPVVPENGLAFVMNIDPKTGVSKLIYNKNNPGTITVGARASGSTVSNVEAGNNFTSCFDPCSLTESTTQCGLATAIESFAHYAPQEVFRGLGLESKPNQFPYIVRFNTGGNCLQTRILLNNDKQPYVETMFVDPGSGEVLCSNGRLVQNPTECGYDNNGRVSVAHRLSFNLKLVGAESQGGIAGTVSFVVDIDPMYDFPFLFYTVPQVGSTITFRSVNAVEPVFVINNLPVINNENKNANISLCAGTADTTKTYTPGDNTFTPGCGENDVGVVNESTPDTILYSTPGIIKTKDNKEFKLNLVFGGSNTPNNGVNVKLPDGQNDPEGNSFDVLGNVATKYDKSIYASSPIVSSDLTAEGVTPNDFENIALCSGDNWCTAKQLSDAEASIRKIVNAEMKVQVGYIERYDAEGFMNNMGDALTSCLNDVLNAMVANWAQMEMCNTMAQFCSGENTGVPLQDYTVQQGESMGWGDALNPSNLLSGFDSVLSDVFCHETQLGANIQYLAGLTQSPEGKAYLTQLLMKRLEANSQPVKTVLSPVTPEPSPTFNFVLKGAADNVSGDAHPGFNIFAMTYNPVTALQNNNVEATFITFGGNGWVLPSIEKGINNVAALPTASLKFLFYTIPTAAYNALTAQSPLYPQASLTSGAMPFLNCPTPKAGQSIECFVDYTKSVSDVNLYTVNKYLFDSNIVKSICDNGVGQVSKNGVDCTTIKSVSTSGTKTNEKTNQIPVMGGGVTVSTSSVQQPPVIKINLQSQQASNADSLSLNAQETQPNTLTITTTSSSASCSWVNLINFIFNSNTHQTNPSQTNRGMMSQTDVNTVSCTTPLAK